MASAAFASSSSASPSSVRMSFKQAAVQAVRTLYPEALADKSWDNTGLLLESPSPPPSSQTIKKNNSVLLTVDLTRAVADEAIERGDSVIISYHPIIFRPLKSLTLADPQQRSLLKLAQEGINVYSPHTAVDAAPGGLNDWLADIVCGSVSKTPGRADGKGRRVIQPVEGVEGLEHAGYGRTVHLPSPIPLVTLLERIQAGLQVPDLTHVPIAIPHNSSLSQIDIQSIGICAGSGGTLLRALNVDVLFTGELSHHETLAAVEAGKVVIAPFHSNTERGFLRQVMREALTRQIGETWRKSGGMVGEEDGEGEVEFHVSERDRDPFRIVPFRGT
ncbi:MAG: hypothetical protein M1817_006734 [Caeruleum heppii]|nr:MAG: hypothetical protein M1817_006734 [Caeruleum heppii]